MKTRHLFTLAALLTFFCQNALSQTPTVETDKRFVRGATMAFGRMTVTKNDATIAKQGFCYGETPEPTVSDHVNEATLSNNGDIYWLKNLKPATKYYMRAYATTSDGTTVYGEAIKFYTVPKGNVTFSLWRGEADDATYNRIFNAITDACNYFNNMCYTTRDYDVAYSPGTPTADCNYTTRPHMNVGANVSYQRTGTIMHEMQHGMGLQNYSTQWCKSNLRSGNGTGYWLGDRVTEALQFWDNNSTSRLNGDNIHMWPYGVNGAHEDNGSEVLYLANAMICQALGEDGLEHNESRHADPYYSLEQEDTVKLYIKNEAVSRGRYSSFLMPNASGSLRWVEMSVEEALANDSAAWFTTFTPANQYYQFRNAGTGRYITSTGANFTTVERTTPTANENLHLMKGRVDVNGQRGYWMIHPESNWQPRCLNASAGSLTTAAVFNIANSAETQRWLIYTADELKTTETKNMASVKKDVNAIIKQLKTLAAVPHTELKAGTDDAFAEVISTLESRTKAATSTQQLLSINKEAKAAVPTFLQYVTPNDSTKPFELTFLMTNPTFATDAEGWSEPATVNYECAEFFEKTFDFNQTISNLPAGKFQVTMQGFQRPGSSEASYKAYKEGDTKTTAYLYAGSKSVQLAHIASGARTSTIGTGTEVTIENRFIPNNMQASSSYFRRSAYPNSVSGTVSTQGGSLKTGVRSSDMGKSYWVCFDTFRLFFYGPQNNDELLGVQSATLSDSHNRHNIYTLDGRRLANDAWLRPGLYIINGKKVVVR